MVTSNRSLRANRCRRCSLVFLVLLGSLLAIPREVISLGARIPNQDATAIGRGNAFTATADNPSAMYYNPAGITQLDGQTLQAGVLTYLNIYADYESPSGERFENNTKLIPVPQLGYVLTLKDKPFSFGLGVYAPFGLGMEWPDDVPFRNAALEAQLTYVTVNPVVAWRVHPTLSIAVGPTFNYSDATLRQGVAVSPYYFKFNGDDIAFGFNAGLLWQPHPQWSFGAKYVSATTLDYDGTASFHPAASFLPRPMDTKTHVDFPQMAAGGVSYRPTTNWNIEVDIEWTDWDTTKSVDIDRVGRLVLNWQSSFFYEFGITRELGKGFFASAGYFFSEASTPEKDYTPLVPDTNLHIGSLGFGYKGQRWNWALAGQIIGGSFRTVSGANNPAVDGKYRIFTPTISLAVAYHF